MKAVVFHDIGDIRLDDVQEPAIRDPYDAIVQLTASAICGTDLHMVRGTMPGMVPGTILGHEGVGVVEEIGTGVRNLSPGDRVVIPSTIGCGNCSYCRSGYYAQCDKANPVGPWAGTAFFGGPKTSGPFNGLQAQKARIPFANVGLVKLPEEVEDDQAILLSDILPTAYMAAENAEIKPGNTVAVFGCGPVGLFCIACAKLLDAGRILAVDTIESRLEMAQDQGAEVIDFNQDDPLEAIKELTGGIGVDRLIDAVGVDANRPHSGPAAKGAKQEAKEVQKVAPKTNPRNGNWEPGDAPSQVLTWSVEAVAKAGTLSIIGVYSEMMKSFPIGKAMEKNLTIKMGNCNHRRYIPNLIELVRNGTLLPSEILTQVEPLTSVIAAYKAFDKREPGWIKVKLEPWIAEEIAA
ncbi:MAG: glutathione-dependent formaldehyde dehydrogenase [Acidobacteria bacterium]|nr:MAG: glutathione-dependent formaldehyde dehydrogenase [Acidobacteriota bacterium]